MLALSKRSYDQPRQHIRKQRDYLADKGPSSQKAMVFPVRSAKKSIQSILKEIIPEYSLGELMLKLKFYYFGHLMRTDSLAKTLMLRKTEGRKRTGWQRTRWLDGISSMDMSLSKLQGLVRRQGTWCVAVHGAKRVGYDWGTEKQIGIKYNLFRLHTQCHSSSIEAGFH